MAACQLVRKIRLKTSINGRFFAFRLTPEKSFGNRHRLKALHGLLSTVAIRTRPKRRSLTGNVSSPGSVREARFTNGNHAAYKPRLATPVTDHRLATSNNVPFDATATLITTSRTPSTRKLALDVRPHPRHQREGIPDRFRSDVEFSQHHV